jgi:hypothetical protein
MIARGLEDVLKNNSSLFPRIANLGLTQNKPKA